MLRFSEEDVIKLANGVLDCPIECQYNNNGSDYYYCKFCYGVHCKKGLVRHDTDCITLIAQNILAGVDN